MNDHMAEVGLSTSNSEVVPTSPPAAIVQEPQHHMVVDSPLDAVNVDANLVKEVSLPSNGIYNSPRSSATTAIQEPTAAPTTGINLNREDTGGT